MGLYRLIRPLLFRLPAEMAHHLALYGLKRRLVPAQPHKEYPSLRCTLWGMEFANPIGMAAGFDKDAEVINPLLEQGFGFVEVGTVTPLPQAGNPTPRLFRLTQDKAIINRMGFNNRGGTAFLQKLERWGQQTQGYEGIVGANIGKNKDTVDPLEDYLTLYRKVYGLSDYITINISSPNTPGLRGLQRREELEILLDALMKLRKELAENLGKIPLLVKIAPDLDAQARKDIADVALTHRVDGLIVTNTTISRPATLKSGHKSETGGLSGAPLTALALEVLRDIYQLTEAKIPLIGVGGISSAEEAYARIRAGASLIQVYTAFIYEGFGLVNRMKKGLAEKLERDGFNHISEAVGADFR